MGDLAQYLASAVVLMSLYALIGASLGLILGVTRTFHLAYASIYTAAAYLFYLLYTVVGWHVAAAAAAAVALSVALGLACEAGVYDRLRRSGSSALVVFLASFGVTIVLQNVPAMLFGNDTKMVALHVRQNFELADISFSLYEALAPIAAVVLVPFLLLFVHRTRAGQGMLALADNPEGAQVVGIDVSRTRLLTFGLGSALAVVPSLLTALATSIYPTMGLGAVFVGFAAAIVGGIGRLEGAILGGIVIGLASGLGAWAIGAEWQTAIVFLILILTLFLRPTGIFGTHLWKSQV